MGEEDRMHVQFGQLMLQYEFYNKSKWIFFTYLPFGEQRTKLTGGLLKKKGCKRGVPDFLFIREKNKVAEMIWLEFKTDKGKQSREQFNFQVNCEHVGNMRYYLPRSVEEAVKIVEEIGLIKS